MWGPPQQPVTGRSVFLLDLLRRLHEARQAIERAGKKPRGERAFILARHPEKHKQRKFSLARQIVVRSNNQQFVATMTSLVLHSPSYAFPCAARRPFWAWPVCFPDLCSQTPSVFVWHLACDPASPYSGRPPVNRGQLGVRRRSHFRGRRPSPRHVSFAAPRRANPGLNYQRLSPGVLKVEPVSPRGPTSSGSTSAPRMSPQPQRSIIGDRCWLGDVRSSSHPGPRSPAQPILRARSSEKTSGGTGRSGSLHVRIVIACSSVIASGRCSGIRAALPTDCRASSCKQSILQRKIALHPPRWVIVQSSRLKRPPCRCYVLRTTAAPVMLYQNTSRGSRGGTMKSADGARLASRNCDNTESLGVDMTETRQPPDDPHPGISSSLTSTTSRLTTKHWWFAALSPSGWIVIAVVILRDFRPPPTVVLQSPCFLDLFCVSCGSGPNEVMVGGARLNARAGAASLPLAAVGRALSFGVVGVFSRAARPTTRSRGWRPS